MIIQQLRNATVILHLGDRRILVDPMLGEVGSFRNFKRFGDGQRPNPIIPLPDSAQQALEEVTDCVITHCQRDHLDHIDAAGIEFLKKNDLPLWSVADDFDYLQDKGLAPAEFVDGSLDMSVHAIKARHAHGEYGDLLGPGHGWFLHLQGEPSVYLTGDTVLVESVRDCITTMKPDVIIAPAGCANFGKGEDILFSRDELVELAKLAPGKVVFNHMEALDHCPTTRKGLRELLDREGVGGKCLIPTDGELIEA